MSLGIGQLILILLLVILLFGNLPKLFKDVGEGIKDFQRITKKDTKKDKKKD